VDVLVDGGVEKCSVDVKLTQLKVSGDCDDKEEAQAGHADDMREGLRIVEANALAAPFGDEPCFGAEDIACGAGLDFVDPHVVSDHAVKGKIDKFPRAVVYEGGILLLHSGLPLWGLGAGETHVQRSVVRFGFHTFSGGKESDGML
jgi:hypothetical protein